MYEPTNDEFKILKYINNQVTTRGTFELIADRVARNPLYFITLKRAEIAINTLSKEKLIKYDDILKWTSITDEGNRVFFNTRSVRREKYLMWVVGLIWPVITSYISWQLKR